MIIKFFELEKKNIKNKKYFLLYGNNKGLIQETIKNKIEPLISTEAEKYEESQVIENPESFLEKIYNKSFFENEKLIIIFRATDKLLKILEEIINKDTDDIMIVLVSGVLEKKSKLRNFFEKSKETICVPFYEDNLNTLGSLASKFFKEKKIAISQQNINLLVNRSRGDRINLYNELNKIENYLVDKKQIKLDEILKLTNLSENYDLTELVDSSLSKNQSKTLTILNENNFAGEDSILVLRIFIRKLKRLLNIQLQNLDEKNIDKSISNFKPPIFWKEKETVKQQLKIWSLNKIQKSLVEVNNLELLVKKNPTNSTNIITNFILEQVRNPNN
jgi:DNA polymerase-3 subunit delta